MRTCDHVLKEVHPRSIFKRNLAYFRKSGFPISANKRTDFSVHGNGWISF